MMLRACLLLLATALPLFAQEAPQPPVAPTKPKEIQIHGEKLIDNYFYLREKENKEVISYLEKENAYTATIMKSTEALQDKLYKEILGRIKQTDLSVPTLNNGYWYYSRTVEGQQYSIICRKKGTLEAVEEVMLVSSGIGGSWNQQATSQSSTSIAAGSTVGAGESGTGKELVGLSNNVPSLPGAATVSRRP